MADLTDDDILSELGLEAEPEKRGGRSHEEARIIAGYEDIVRFVDEHGRKPEHGEGKDIFERLYAVRLDRIRGNAAYRALVATCYAPPRAVGRPFARRVFSWSIDSLVHPVCAYRRLD